MAYESKLGGRFNKESAVGHLEEFDESLRPIQGELFRECGLEGEENEINTLAVLFGEARVAIQLAIGFMKHRMP